jgi:hypothetical protein
MTTFQKLTPNQDLQCYFYQPSAVAALSSTSPNGFAVSGCWRAQSDWVVVEWNRDNVFEHPVFRNLPDSDLSGLQLSYLEARSNCIPIDSTLYPTVDWPYLRVWADPGTGEQLYRIPLMGYATPVAGTVICRHRRFSNCVARRQAATISSWRGTKSTTHISSMASTRWSQPRPRWRKASIPSHKPCRASRTARLSR